MTNPKWEEEIIVVSRKELFEDEELTFQGTQTNSVIVQALLENIEKHHTTMRRGGGHKDTEPAENNAEINYDYKQPIPYALIKRGHELFAYERLAGGGETRLHSKISLGVGGHMNKTKGTFNDSLLDNLRRELNEEVDIQADYQHMETIGFINDDNEDVSKVHIGLLVVINLPEDAEVTVRETDQLRGFWMPIAELLENQSAYERLENWSQIAVDYLYNYLPESELSK